MSLRDAHEMDPLDPPPAQVRVHLYPACGDRAEAGEAYRADGKDGHWEAAPVPTSASALFSARGGKDALVRRENVGNGAADLSSSVSLRRWRSSRGARTIVAEVDPNAPARKRATCTVWMLRALWCP